MAQSLKTREEAKNVIFEYIEVFYNRIRIHSTIQYMSPVEFENIQKYA
ncbi:MAG: transposase [Rickettsiaceae bacterium]|jgi:transposase InsO family protein|nr:transposase [Rickettsiaceae bacterium]